MPLEVFPQFALIYPNDRQCFTVRGTPPPALWSGLGSGVQINSDYSAELTFGSTFIIAGAYLLESNIGSVALTISNNCKPTSGGKVWFQLVSLAGSLLYRIEILPTEVKTYSGNPTLLSTISHTVAAGDIFTLDVAGGVFRLLINGTQQHLFSTSHVYPIGYTLSIDTPVTTSPVRVTTPLLIGDWHLQAAADWTTPAHGSLSAASGETTEYFDGTQPGTYSLEAKIAASALQADAATIVIPPLTLTGNPAVTLQPGSKYRFRTNYESAQTRLVTWSAIGGGSFNNDQYTAPTAPGTYTARATYGTQQADATVTIPIVITSSVGAAAEIGEQVTFTSNLTGTLTWTADRGSPSSVINSAFVWTAPTQPGERCLIKVSNGSQSLTLEIVVWKKFAYDPTWGWEGDYGVDELVSRAEDGSRTTRVKSKDGRSRWELPLTFRTRTLTELEAVLAFYDEQKGGVPFIFEDKLRAQRYVVYFESKLRAVPAANCAIDYSFRLSEKA